MPTFSLSPLGFWFNSYPALSVTLLPCLLSVLFMWSESALPVQLTMNKSLCNQYLLWQFQLSSTAEFLWGEDSFPLASLPCLATRLKKLSWEKQKWKKKKKTKEMLWTILLTWGTVSKPKYLSNEFSMIRYLKSWKSKRSFQKEVFICLQWC